MAGGPLIHFARIATGERKKEAALSRVSLDLHVHALLSKRFPFEMSTVDRLMAEAVRRGLSGFALTEHIHAPDFWLAHSELRDRFGYWDGAYRGGPVPMLSGAEITVVDDGRRADTIVIGPLDELETLDRSFRPALSAVNHVPLAELIDAIDERDLLLIAAHPFRPEKRLASWPRADLARCDAVEVNGKDVFTVPGAVSRTRRLAAHLRLPVVASSDCHFWPQLGVVRTLLPEGTVGFDLLQRALADRDTGFRTRPHGGPIVRFCRTHKTLVKSLAATAAERVAVA